MLIERNWFARRLPDLMVRLVTFTFIFQLSKAIRKDTLTTPAENAAGFPPVQKLYFVWIRALRQ